MTEKREINIHNLVTQSNRLIESRYNLNITEQRLILAMISMINPEDEDFREYNIKISDLSKVLGIKNKNIYNEIKNITESIMTKVIKIKNSDGLLQINWISSAQYNDHSGIVTLKFDPSLKPYLLNIKENYTSTKFGITAKFKSFYSTRIYLLVKQYEKIGKRVVLVDFLKEVFPQYSQYKDIKKRILIPAQKEINEVSDIKFEMDEKKVGKKVKEVIFFNIKSQSYMQELPLYPSPIKNEENLSKVINEKYEVELSIAEKLVKEIDSKDVKEEFKNIFKYIDSCIFNKNIKNIPGFVVDCIRKGYYKNSSSTEKKATTTPTLGKEYVKEEIILDNKNEFFLKFIENLKKELEEDEYNKWFSDLDFVKKEEDILTFAIQSKFLRDWIIREYLDEVMYPIALKLDKSIRGISIIYNTSITK